MLLLFAAALAVPLPLDDPSPHPSPWTTPHPPQVLLLFAAVLAVSSFKILADGGDDEEVR